MTLIASPRDFLLPAADPLAPAAFQAAMTARWTALKNVPNPRLQSLWTTMAETFNRAILANDRPNSPWLVLEPPTGSGKTQGLCVYAAELLKADLLRRPEADRPDMPGILVVTRLIDQAEEIARTIRELAGLPLDDEKHVVAKHSRSTATADQMQSAAVLVITHAAYTNALEGLVKDTTMGKRWTDYVEWVGGHRKLTIIDEALAGVVEEFHLRAEHIRQVTSFIDPRLAAQFAGPVAALGTIRDTLGKIDAMSPQNAARSRIPWRAVADGRAEFPTGLAMDGLREAMKELPFDRMTLGRTSPLDRTRIATRVDNTLRSAEAILARWAYYHKIGAEPSFNASQLLIPPGLPGPVILDATASQNFLWELLEGRAEVVVSAKNARSYANVTLHVLRSLGTGKSTMTARANTRFPRVFSALTKALPSTSKTLFITHKDNEHHALGWQHPFTRFSVGHWGAIDGRNDWQDHDAVVLFGLPHRPDTWANNLFFALQGLPQSCDWFDHPEWKGFQNVRKEIEVRQLAVDCVQAVNRVRCRRVTDASGNCDPTQVFVVLPPGDLGDELLGHLIEEMPGVVVTDWDHTLDGEGVRIRRGSSHEALVAFMRNRCPGETAMTTLRKELGLTERAVKELQVVLRDPGHELTKRLAELGVSYVSTGKGARSYLNKR